MTRLSAFAFALLALVFALALGFGGPESPIDRSILIAMQIDGLVGAARLLTRLGDWWAYFSIGGVAALWLAWRGHRRRALLLIALLLSERLLVTLLKLLFGRARPDPLGHLDPVSTLSFPSGHSTNSMTLGLGLALLLASPSHRKPAVAAALVFAFAVGATRLVLGVHWPSDVAAGWALGTLWTLLLVRLAGGTSPSPRH
ncbi:MAG TPA: phosphatase PAP2 family protein [Allosphingosinicella sp.]|jgi:undecaprenyl-diphosphatase